MAVLATLIGVTLAISLCYVIGTTVWSVFFGGLSKIPGPKLAAVTRLILVRKKIRGEAEAWRLDLHRKYGDVVRVAPNEVSFAAGSAWREIYGAVPGTQTARFQKDPASYGRHDKNGSLPVVGEIDHPRQRKCFTNAFSEKTMRQWEPMVQSYIAKMIRNIERTTNISGQKFNINSQFNFVTFDIMGELSWGGPLGCLDTQVMDSWVSRIFGSIRAITIIQELKVYPNLERLVEVITPPAAKRIKRAHFKYSEDRVDARLAEKSTPEEKNYRLTKDEIYANAGIFLIAGTETSATLLTSLTYYLLTNPKWMTIAAEEVRQKFAATGPQGIRSQDLTSLKHLHACINEAFRIHPPVPIGLARLVSKGGAEICGYQLPEDTSVYVHQLSCYLNKNNFAHPDRYLPQRWLSEDDIKSIKDFELDGDYTYAHFVNDDKSSLQPFSMGPRNCIGLTLAWLEIRIIMAQILWHFDLQLCEESRDWPEQRIFSFWEMHPLMVTARPVAR